MSNRFDVPQPADFDPYLPHEESYPMAPARSIPVTDELRAEDAALQAARELTPDHPWAAVKATLSAENLSRVRRCSTPGCGKPLSAQTVGLQCRDCRNRILAAKSAAREAARAEARKATPRKAAAPKRAITITAPPTLPTGETTMSEPITCKGGCGRIVSPFNVKIRFFYSNKCSKKKGCAPPDNSSAKKAQPAKKAAAAKPIRSGLVKSAPPSLTPAVVTAAHGDMVMLRVPSAALDAFWTKLSQEEKARIVANELLRSHGLQEVASA